MNDKLNELIERCKAGVSISFNEHRNYYESVEGYVGGLINHVKIVDEKPDDYEKMVASDIVVELHFYPETPVGFYHLVGYELEPLLDKAIAILNEDKS